MLFGLNPAILKCLTLEIAKEYIKINFNFLSRFLFLKSDKLGSCELKKILILANTISSLVNRSNTYGQDRNYS